MRPSPRLSLFAILSGLVLASATMWAAVYEYDMSHDDNGLTSQSSAAAWTCHSIVKNNNHAGYNGGGDYIQSTSATAMPITNLWVKYQSSSVNASRRLYLERRDEAGTTVLGARLEFSVPKEKVQITTNFVFQASENVRNLKMIAEGSSGTWIIYNLTVCTTDPPPPTLESIEDQNIGSNNEIDHLPVIAETNVAGDTLTVSATTESNIPAASYGIFEENGNRYFRFSPEDAGMTSGSVVFTVSATGIGGTTSVSFTVTVTAGVVKTEPTFDPIPGQSALALRTLTVPFTVREADGDEIRTNYFCQTSGVTGSYGIDANGSFFYTPSLADAAIGTVAFRITATDTEGTGQGDFNVTVTAGTPPVIGPIAPQTVVYDGMNEVTLALTPTDGDKITATNVTVKTGT